jgi:pimeloyl-[acyl-carrier protein] methyl ester esterase
MRLHSETLGSGADLVLIHGWGMNGALWGGLAESLAEQYRVTVLELPGHGHSPYEPQASSLEHWAAACLDGAPESAVWIGWSLGGQVAQRAALTAPDRVQRLMVVAGTPRFVQGPEWPHAMDEATLKQFAASLVEDHGQTLGRFLSLQVRGDDDARNMLRLLRQELAKRPQPDPAALEAGLDLLLTVDLREDLASLHCPSLWLLSADGGGADHSRGGPRPVSLPSGRVPEIAEEVSG